MGAITTIICRLNNSIAGILFLLFWICEFLSISCPARAPFYVVHFFLEWLSAPARYQCHFVRVCLSLAVPYYVAVFLLFFRVTLGISLGCVCVCVHACAHI